MLLIYLVILAAMIIVALVGCSDNDPLSVFTPVSEWQWEKVILLSDNRGANCLDNEGQIHSVIQDNFDNLIYCKWSEEGEMLDSTMLILTSPYVDRLKYPQQLYVSQENTIYFLVGGNFQYLFQLNTPGGIPLRIGFFQLNHLSFAGNKIYASNPGHDESIGGIQLSSDNGLTWKYITPHDDDMSFYFCYETSNGNLITGCNTYDSTNFVNGIEGKGFYLSTNGGERWLRKSSNFFVDAAIDDQDNIYVADYENGVFLTSNYGSTWTQLLELKNCDQIRLFRETILVALEYNYSGNDILHISYDRGKFWERIELPANEYSKQIYLSSSGRIYFSTRGYGLWRTKDPIIN